MDKVLLSKTAAAMVARGNLGKLLVIEARAHVALTLEILYQYFGQARTFLALANVRVVAGIEHVRPEIQQDHDLACAARHAALGHLVPVGVRVLEPHLSRLLAKVGMRLAGVK
ncbi:MAG: hypothetical protein HC794_10520 [Nitrospiraceae bacterium]|nr:hypothetical protein [Nitrospiraceae bacterium]